MKYMFQFVDDNLMEILVRMSNCYAKLHDYVMEVMDKSPDLAWSSIEVMCDDYSTRRTCGLTQLTIQSLRSGR